MTALRITPLNRAETWKVEESPIRRDPEYFAVRHGMLHLLDGYASDLANLLSRDAKNGSIVIQDTVEQTSKTVSAKRITFYIREPGPPSLTVKQFAEILEAIDGLYAVVTQAYAIEEADLFVTSMDSGSDFSMISLVLRRESASFPNSSCSPGIE